jgi:hypothetical protein
LERLKGMHSRAILSAGQDPLSPAAVDSRVSAAIRAFSRHQLFQPSPAESRWNCLERENAQERARTRKNARERANQTA